LQTAFGDDGRRGRCRRGPHPQRNPGQHSNQCGTEPANVPHQAPRFVDRIRDSNDRTDAKGARKCTVSWVARADSPRRSVITATARAQSTHTGWHPCTQGVDMRVRTKWFGALAAVAAGIAASAIAVMPSASAQSAAAPDKLPVTVTNDSGRSEQVHLYVLGIKDGQLGYVDQAGDFSAWPPGSNPPSPAPDVSIPGPDAGESTTVNIPKGLSGRIYMSFGDELEFFLTPDGLVQPAPWNPSDPNHDILFDWSELTYNDEGLWLNSTQVDMFAVPHAVSVTGADGTTQTRGELKPGGRNAVFDGLRDQAGWGDTIVTRGDGTVLRALAPGKAAEAGLLDANYL